MADYFGVSKKRVGRPVTTGYTSADNFRSKFLNKTGFNYKRVYGTMWFLIEQPQLSANTDWQRLKTGYVLRPIKEFTNASIKPYTHIVFIDRIIPDDKEIVANKIYYTFKPTQITTTYRSCPLWFNQAGSWLKMRGISYHTVERLMSTQKEVLTKQGLHARESLYPDDPIVGWRLIGVELPPSTPFPTVHIPLYDTEEQEVHNYILLRDYATRSTAPAFNTGPSARERVAERWFMWCANNMTDDGHLRPHNKYTSHEEVLAALVKAMEYIAQENGVVLEIKHTEYCEMQGTELTYREWCEQKVMSILHSLQEDPISWAETEAEMARCDGCDEREQTVAALI